MWMHYLAIICQKWKPDQCYYSSQLSHDLGWNKTGLTWLPDLDRGKRNENGFLAIRSADYEVLEATGYTGWVVKRVRWDLTYMEQRKEEGVGRGELGVFWHLTHVCFSQGKPLAPCSTSVIGTRHTSPASGNLESGLKGKYFYWKSSVDT